jgi:hypothetical protein
VGWPCRRAVLACAVTALGAIVLDRRGAPSSREFSDAYARLPAQSRAACPTALLQAL